MAAPVSFRSFSLWLRCCASALCAHGPAVSQRYERKEFGDPRFCSFPSRTPSPPFGSCSSIFLGPKDACFSTSISPGLHNTACTSPLAKNRRNGELIFYNFFYFPPKSASSCSLSSAFSASILLCPYSKILFNHYCKQKSD